ncbi:Serine/threonine-protein kinase PINK1, mitochondrial [Liparis tanakae]|uniref:Serine/threonine-protein kinase PINK1, mitochondrial n=1 Tax=Liparis tanakae TaxID=230148 RepID=A0A4Z2FU18_9TELE|nr:Serine/threonine-protein kinase PINK1, mitochondrial [Liparis tanakae]
MSVKHAISRGLELGRSVLQLGLLKAGGRFAAKLRADRLRVGPPARTVQPRAFLPSRYRYYRSSLTGLAAQLQSAGFRRFGGGSPRNRAVFLAFGLGAVFRKKRFQSPFKPFSSGYKLEDYTIGNQIGKGSNAAVYEAAARFAPQESHGKRSKIQPGGEEEQEETTPSLTCCSLHTFPMAVKMIHFGVLPKRMSAHPNVIRVYRAFTADVPLLPGAQEEYPAVLPARLNPDGLGNNRTLFLIMKNYPFTLRQYLEVSPPGRRQGSLMVLQLLEGVDHLCRQGVAHRDLKSDNVLLEFDSDGCPRLVITDFGCCLSQRDSTLQLPFNSMWVNRGGNASLMAPEVITAVPGGGVVIDYSKADAWAVGAISYEIFGQPNPFYRAVGLDSRDYQEAGLPPLPSGRPSARVAANMLHLSLWGGKVLANQDGVGVRKLADWLLCRSAVVLLKGCGGPGGNVVEAELQRSFLSNLDLEDLRTAVGFLLFGREQRQACVQSA